MTRNQIEFANVRETVRHNLATEGKDIRSLEEAVRHNIQEEGVNWYNASTLASLREAQGANLQAQSDLYSTQLGLVEAQTDTEAARQAELYSTVQFNDIRREDLISQIENRLRQYHLNAAQTDAAVRKIEAEIKRSKVQNLTDVLRVIDDYLDTAADWARTFK